MALINEEVQVQQPPSEIPSPEPPRRHASTARVALGWAAVVAAAAAVSVLTVAVFSTEDEPASPVWTGDAKDHPLYRQPATADRQPAAAPTASPVWTGDAKDHPLYRQPATAERQPVAAPTASPVWTGDAKDHPLYRRSAAG